MLKPDFRYTVSLGGIGVSHLQWRCGEMLKEVSIYATSRQQGH